MLEQQATFQKLNTLPTHVMNSVCSLLAVGYAQKAGLPLLQAFFSQQAPAYSSFLREPKSKNTHITSFIGIA